MGKNVAEIFISSVVLLMVITPFVASWLHRRKTKMNLRPMSLEWTQSVKLLKKLKRIDNIRLPTFVLGRFQALGVRFVCVVSGAYYGFVEGQYHDG